jgi:Transposase
VSPCVHRAPASSPRCAVRLSNGRLEGLNSRVRLISHRSFGFHSAAPLIALIYFCCSGITIDLPLR